LPGGAVRELDGEEDFGHEKMGCDLLA
jgi:hypothetical protein